jgi:hypothetical protein
MVGELEALAAEILDARHVQADIFELGRVQRAQCVDRAPGVSSPSVTVDYVFANPPFGKKSSMSFTNDEGEQETDDLNYSRHTRTSVGNAAVFVHSNAPS